MKTEKSIRNLIVICVILLGSAVAGDLQNDYQIIRFCGLAPSDYKFAGGYMKTDWEYRDDWIVTNLVTEPYTLTAVQPSSSRLLPLRNEGTFVFYANPKLTATLRETLTGKETTLSISDTPRKTVHLGTNDYFVVDIRVSTQEVVLKPTKGSTMITLHGVASNATKKAEHDSSPTSTVMPSGGH